MSKREVNREPRQRQEVAAGGVAGVRARQQFGRRADGITLEQLRRVAAEQKKKKKEENEESEESEMGENVEEDDSDDEVAAAMAAVAAAQKALEAAKRKKEAAKMKAKKELKQKTKKGGAAVATASAKLVTASSNPVPIAVFSPEMVEARKESMKYWKSHKFDLLKRGKVDDDRDRAFLVAITLANEAQLVVGLSPHALGLVLRQNETISKDRALLWALEPGLRVMRDVVHMGSEEEVLSLLHAAVAAIPTGLVLTTGVFGRTDLGVTLADLSAKLKIESPTIALRTWRFAGVLLGRSQETTTVALRSLVEGPMALAMAKAAGLQSYGLISR